MLAGKASARADAGNDVGHGDLDLAACHESDLLRLIHELVERDVEQGADLILHDRPVPGHRGSCGKASKGSLGNRRVEHAIWSKLIQKPLGHATQALADVLAHYQHAVVLRHLGPDAFGDCLEVAQPTHQTTLSPVAPASGSRT